MRRIPFHLLSLLAVLLATGCAAGRAAPAPDAAPAAFDPAGTFSFSTTIQGVAVNGRMRITGEPGAYRGSMYTDATGELPLRSIQVDGHEVRMVAETTDGAADVVLQFGADGQSFTGEWFLAQQSGAISGVRAGGG